MATSCVRPPALTAISRVDCQVHFGQLVGLLFQRTQTTPSFATQAAMNTLAAWTPLLAALDATKVIFAPLFAGFVVPGSAAVYVDENSNNSIDGLGFYAGANAVKAAGDFLGLPSAVKAQLALLGDESRPGLSPGLSAYWVTGDGRIVYNQDPESNAIGGIPLTNFNIDSLKLDGFRTENKNAFGFTMPANWDAALQVTTPAFNPRLALAA